MTRAPSTPAVPVAVAAPRRCRGAAALLALLACGGGVATRAQDLADPQRAALQHAMDRVAPAVVQIRTVGGVDQVDGAQIPNGPTTGLLISPEGYLVSSAFNFAQRPSSILVRMPDGSQQAAQWIGRDLNCMLVLLKVEPIAEMPAIETAPLAELQPGQWAVALGRTFVAERPNVSVGIVSQLGRMLGRVIQTDAAVSAANYGGPLVDVSGRVMGVLAPMAPQSTPPGEAGELAGAEYYDSGIGFAVPLEHIRERLPRWIAERDLHRGLLGISMIPGNPHAKPPRLTTVWPDSPASRAGWQAGDTIVAVDGQPVPSQTRLRFALARRYAGDAVRVALQRPQSGGEPASGPREESAPPVQTVETELTLVKELPPYRAAFLGALPAFEALGPRSPAPPAASATPAPEEARRESAVEGAAPDGVLVRAIWPASPAAEAGLLPGDLLTALDGRPIAEWGAAHAVLRSLHPGAPISAVVRRGAEEVALASRLAVPPERVLTRSELVAPPLAADAAVLRGELKLPDLPQTARYAAPEAPEGTCGLLVWLGSAEETAEESVGRWTDFCREARVAVVVAAPADADAGWDDADLPFLARLLPLVQSRLRTDPLRVAVGGVRQAGQTAYKLGLARRGTVRGVAAVDAPLPRTLKAPGNSPEGSLAFLAAANDNSPLAVLLRNDVVALRGAGYPAVLELLRGDSGSELAPTSEPLRDLLTRWLLGLGAL